MTLRIHATIPRRDSRQTAFPQQSRAAICAKLRAMKPKFGREIALLTLPVLLIGAVSWWNTQDRTTSKGNEAEVEVLEAAMFPPWLWQDFEIHMRHKSKQFWVPTPGQGTKRLRLLDGNGREVILLPKYDPIRPIQIFFYFPEDVKEINPEIPKNERVVAVMTGGGAPKGGWNSIKRPLWIAGEVSDGECLPTPFKVRIEERQGGRRDFGVR